MEVCLVASNGLPEEAILSIRAGAVRRQGPVSSNRSFRFPRKEKMTEADQVLKVDIHQKVGSGYLVLKPNQDGVKQYRVILNGSGRDMDCELEVRPAVGGVDKASVIEEVESSAVKAKDATQYLESKGILQFVQGVLQVVVKEQPEDPFSLMARHFQEGYDAPLVPPGRPSTAPSAPVEGRRRHNAPTSPAGGMNIPKASTGHQQQASPVAGWAPPVPDAKATMREPGTLNVAPPEKLASSSIPVAAPEHNKNDGVAHAGAGVQALVAQVSTNDDANASPGVATAVPTASLFAEDMHATTVRMSMDGALQGSEQAH